jgi:P-type Ca2+ transporter type 2C
VTTPLAAANPPVGPAGAAGATPPTVTAWYAQDAAAVASAVEVDTSKGLDDAEVQRRLAKYGRNALPKDKPPSALSRFLAEYKSFLQIILLAAAVVSFLTKQIPMGILLVGLTLVNAIIGMLEEGKAASALDSLQKMVSPQARVRRNGAEATIDRETLVPGDVVLLAAGDQVPADGRVIQASALQVDESSLTGESTPSGKQVDPPAAKGDQPLAPADQVDMVFKHTDVTHGSGEMLVTATGVHTTVGGVAQMLSGATDVETPLTKQLNRMTMWIAAAAAATMVAVFAAGLLRGLPFDQLFNTAIALALAAVPEALPTVVTVILSLGSVALARRNAVVKSLSSVETLGEVSAINSDKTGTLTMNQMTVVEVISGPDCFKVTGIGYALDGKVLRQAGATDSVDPLIHPFVLANDGQLKDGGVVGDPLDGALLVLAHKAGIDSDATRAGVERIATVPFDPSYKLMAVFTRPTGAAVDSPADVSVKGAPQAVLARCATQRTDGGTAPLDQAAAKHAADEVNRLEAQGLRVLAAASGTVPAGALEGQPDLLGLLADLQLTAMVGMIDPPRDSSKAAVQAAQAAHVEVRMVTGDDVVTGAAVAKQLGIPGRAISGAELSAMSDEQALAQIDGIGVIARVAPADKQRLVKIMQTKGYVVASTGDGVNDAPALKAADIGVAMGTGTEVAKNAGRMVLQDDNFATILYAVEQGRKLYDNLRKYVRFILITLVTFVLTFLVATLLNIAAGAPFTAQQILWINFLIDTPLGVALGFDKESAGLMTREPLRRGASIITRRMLVTVSLVSVVMTIGVLGLLMHGERAADPVLGSTLALTTFGFFRIVCAWESRSPTDSAITLDTFRNQQLNVLIVVVVVLIVLATELEPLRRLLGTTPLDGIDWLVCLAAAAVLFALWELGKLVARKREHAENGGQAASEQSHLVGQGVG